MMQNGSSPTDLDSVYFGFGFQIMRKKSTVITIDSELHAEIKSHCDVRGLKVGHLASKALREYLTAEAKGAEPTVAAATLALKKALENEIQALT